MSKRRVVVSGLALALVGSAFATVSLPAPARADFAAVEATAALDLPTGVSVLGTTGSPASRSLAARSDHLGTTFNDFPSNGSDYLMLSSGDASEVFEGIATSQLSTDFGDDAVPDSSSLTLNVAASTGAGCLFVDFAMGTEEVLGYTAGNPDDRLSIVRANQEYAVNAGRGYFHQEAWPAQPKPYRVNSINYWHKPGDVLDPQPGTDEEPRLADVTGLNHVTSLDTARIPLTFVGGDETITFTVTDAPELSNGDLDSVGFFDNVRLGHSCDSGTGIEPRPETRDVPNACCGTIRGERGVGNALVYDPIPSTQEIERYDGVDNGWRSPSAGQPVELRFRWYRASSSNKNVGNMNSWAPIPNADRQSYVPNVVDKGRVLIVMVTGMVDGRRVETWPSTSESASWYVTLPIGNGRFLGGEGPTVVEPTGGAKVGEVVSAQIGDASPKQDTYDFQWYANGTSLSGQSGRTMVVPESAAGKVLTVRAVAKRASFDDRSWTSPGSSPVQYQRWASRPQPQIAHDGTPANGDTLSVNTGTWLPETTTHSYQWKRDGQLIAGAKSATYVLRDSDVGTAITVDVAGVKTGYAQEPQTSAAVSPRGRTMAGVKPTITGRAVIGERLTGGPRSADWDPSYATLTYSWYVGTTVVQSGSSRYYEVSSTAVGKRITLAITGRKSGYTTSTFVSTPTAVVPRGVITPGSVRIYGTARVGSTLRVSTTSWSPRPVTLGYRWKIGSKLVGGAAGRASSLRLPKSAKGKRVTVIVTGSRPAYTTVQRTAVSSKVARQ